MDLSTIRNRLQRGEYEEPWALCDDVRLMVDNACLYNKRISRVHRAALKVRNCLVFVCTSLSVFGPFLVQSLNAP